MSGPLACAVASNSYLPFARVLARSFLRHHPGATVHLLVVDRPHADHDYDTEPFTVTFAEQLGVERFAHLACHYNVVELSNALKPHFMTYLHDKTGCQILCYLDTDILVTASLADLYRRLETADLILTPHILAPVEDSSHTPHDRHFLLSGTFNLGFLGVSFTPDTVRFLGWWQRRLARECLLEVARGLQHDQRWIDLAPSFLSGASILRDPGYNVAYWNLPHRRLIRREDGWWVGDVPLRFYHFSGLDLHHPEEISRFQDRYTLADRPDLAELFSTYVGAVMDEGYEEMSSLPYGFGTFANGVPIPEVARQALRRADPDGVRWPDPFAVDGDDPFYSWLLEPINSEHPVPVPRLALETWQDRTDLQRSYPQPGGRDLLAFAEWYATTGAREQRLPEELTAATRQALAAREIAAFDNGVPFPPIARRVLAVTDPAAQRWPDAASTSGTGSFYSWLMEPIDPEVPVPLPRVALHIWKERDDLQELYPDPTGRDYAGFARWFADNRQDCELDEEMVAPTREALAARAATMFDNGIPFPPVAAPMLNATDPRAQRWPDPAATQPQPSFYAWLLEPDDSQHPLPLPRIALRIWQERDDLRQRFPQPQGNDRYDFASWLAEHGGRQFGLPDEMVAMTREALSAREYAQFDNGVPFPELARRALWQVDPAGRRWPDPTDAGSADSFYAWLAEPVTAEHPVPLPRAALLAWQEREDLQRRWPEPSGRHLYDLAQWYVESGAAECGFGEELVRPTREALTVSRFDNGALLPTVARLALRSLDPEGRRWPRPTATGDEGSFYQWLSEPVGAGHPIPLPRAALLLWDERDDLQQQFPEPAGSDLYELVEWLCTYALGEDGIGEELLAPTRQALARRQPERFDNGVAVPAIALRALHRTDPLAERWPDPAATDKESFFAWLVEPVATSGSIRLTRLALQLREERADLCEAFPDPQGADALAFAVWVVNNAGEQAQISAELLEPIRASLPEEYQA